MDNIVIHSNSHTLILKKNLRLFLVDQDGGEKHQLKFSFLPQQEGHPWAYFPMHYMTLFYKSLQSKWPFLMQPLSWTIKDDGFRFNRLCLEIDLIGGGNGQELPQMECEDLWAPAKGTSLNSRCLANHAPEPSHPRGQGRERIISSLVGCKINLLAHTSKLLWARNWDYSMAFVICSVATGGKAPEYATLIKRGRFRMGNL